MDVDTTLIRYILIQFIFKIIHQNVLLLMISVTM